MARIRSQVAPFYSVPEDRIESEPSILSQPTVIPKSLFELSYERRTYHSEPIHTPYYLVSDGKSVHSPNAAFPKGAIELLPGHKQEILQNPFLPESKRVTFIDREGKITQIGSMREGTFDLERSIRNRMQATRYLSLRDIVNPELSESQVLESIETLYFNPKEKGLLYQLIKILYAGKPSEEYTIVAKLFEDEPEFAQFLSDRIFHIEILPLIHGPFLHPILSKLEEGIIKEALPRLSPPVRKMIQKNLSRNKWTHIQESPIKKPEEGFSLEEILEKEIYYRFSRKIYYETGVFPIYREKTEETNSILDRTENFRSKRSLEFNLTQDRIVFQLYAVTQYKILLKILESVEIVRFLELVSLREIQDFSFFKLPKSWILSIPRNFSSKVIAFGAITASRKSAEGTIQWSDY